MEIIPLLSFLSLIIMAWIKLNIDIKSNFNINDVKIKELEVKIEGIKIDNLEIKQKIESMEIYSRQDHQHINDKLITLIDMVARIDTENSTQNMFIKTYIESSHGKN